MSSQSLAASQSALTAVKAIATEGLHDQLPRTSRRRWPLDLAADIRRMQHAAFVHWLRCNAGNDVLYVIITAIRDAERLLAASEQQLIADVSFVKIYRHRLYATATAAAICVMVRDLTGARSSWPRRTGDPARSCWRTADLRASDLHAAREVGSARVEGIPLWLELSVLLAWATIGQRRVSRRLRERELMLAGQCVACGYDLRASSGRCPQCGQVSTDRVRSPAQ